jgi:hypothetical protein
MKIQDRYINSLIGIFIVQLITKRPVDIKRERRGQAEIGSEEDGAILEMYNLDGRIIVIREHSLYEFFMADDIDPKRTNVNLPTNIHKLIVNDGVDSELVSN